MLLAGGLQLQASRVELLFQLGSKMRHASKLLNGNSDLANIVKQDNQRLPDLDLGSIARPLSFQRAI
jgi:hypothetical protein